MNNKERGRKGGIAKGQKYKSLINNAIYLFINSNLTQKQIADMLDVSQGFISKHTNNSDIKILRLQSKKCQK